MTSAPPPDGAARPSSPLLAKVKVADAVVVAVGFVLFLGLFAVLGGNTGALWRDEVASARLAQLDTWHWMYGSVGEDSFPPLFNTCLRLWIMVGGGSDGWLQNWGYVTAFGLAAALWWSTRGPARTLPVLSGALLFFNASIFYWGHSVRAYGIAAVLLVLFFGALWRFVENPGRGSFALTCGLAILNAQASYQNAPLLLATSLGAATVTALRRQWALSGLIFVPGFLAALSLLIHMRAITHVQDWNIMIRQEFGFDWVWRQMSDALGSAGGAFVWLWVLLAVAVGVLVTFAWRRQRWAGLEREEIRVAIYGMVTIVLATGLVFIFVRRVGYPTQEWYYVPFMALVACAMERAFSSLLPEVRFRIARLALAVVIIAGSIPMLWERAHLRRTNMDLLVAKLRTEATANDLILVRPFYCGIGFQYYYKGSTPWMTLPPIAWSEVHNAYENVKPYVLQNEPMGPVFERIAKTLRAGGRVWFVGGIQFLQPNQRPPASPPAPHPQYGWSDEMYTAIWALQVGYFVQNHVTAASAVPVPCTQPVQRFENLPLVQVSGWRE